MRGKILDALVDTLENFRIFVAFEGGIVDAFWRGLDNSCTTVGTLRIPFSPNSQIINIFALREFLLVFQKFSTLKFSNLYAFNATSKMKLHDPDSNATFLFSKKIVHYEDADILQRAANSDVLVILERGGTAIQSFHMALRVSQGYVEDWLLYYRYNQCSLYFWSPVCTQLFLCGNIFSLGNVLCDFKYLTYFVAHIYIYIYCLFRFPLMIMVIVIVFGYQYQKIIATNSYSPPKLTEEPKAFPGRERSFETNFKTLKKRLRCNQLARAE